MTQEAPALGEETIQPGEDEVFRQIVRTIEAQLDRDYPEGSRPMRRDAHPKHHGAVRATFTVAPDLPPELRQGLFATPRSYAAWIRFSNGTGKIQPDSVKDVRGMAIKVCGVPGEKLLETERQATTQDFLLISGPDFFLRDAAAYLELFKALDRGNPLRFFFPGLNPFRWRMREFRNVTRARPSVANPLTARYWSTVPFRVGPHAARFSARPVGAQTGRTAASSSPDSLREAMSQTLAASGVEFDFLVQLQTDPVTMPVEDPRQPWDESASPYRKVATIHIPQQTFESPAQMTFCENLSFTPWHCLPEHRPLGSVNRARRPVYEAISKKRHAANGVARSEPTGDEQF